MDIVFMHGWASGDFIWHDMEKDFSSYTIYKPNMGFFGQQNFIMPEGKFIGVGHSLGGSWLLKHYPDQMAGFVSIASFNNFYKYIPQQILAKMQRNIIHDMNFELQSFWQHAGLHSNAGFKNANLAKLVEGLTWLSKWSAEIPVDLPIKILASNDDQIVPEKMTQKIWGNHEIKWIKKGGHMLPLTQAEWCVQEIKDFIDDITLT